jgi:hypothetical protein
MNGFEGMHLHIRATVSVLLICISSYVTIQGQQSKRATAKSKSSLNETMNWLRGKLSTYANVNGKQQFELITVGKCSFTWRITRRDYLQESMMSIALGEDKNSSGIARPIWEKSKEEISINLSDFDPTKVSVLHHGFQPELPTWQVVLETFNERKKVSVVIIDEMGKRAEPYYMSNSFIKFSTEDIARRVAKAFSHAITLCGGEKEPF